MNSNELVMSFMPILTARLKDLNYSGQTAWYVRKRFAREGFPFLTRVLPQLMAHIMASIEANEWLSVKELYGFTFRNTKSGRFPAFIAVELEHIMSDSPDAAYHLWRLRELCEYCYKLALPYTTDQLVAAEERFFEIEKELENVPKHLEYAETVCELRSEAAKLFPEIFCWKLDDLIGVVRTSGTFSGIPSGISPASAKDLLDGKYPHRLEAFKGFFRSRKTTLRTGKKFLLRKTDEYPATSDVLFVSKDSRGPRTIVREPYDNLRFQMELHGILKRYLQNKTHGKIQFTDQKRNQELARLASITKENATLDLKEASDRVSYRLFQDIFAHTAIYAHARLFRTRAARIRHIDVPLKKLAGMGSGYTFPVMAMIIYLCIHLATRKRGLSTAGLGVFGDDVVVPVASADLAIRYLEIVGMKINTKKSFINSSFRESCGGDFYRGNTVSPTRIKLNFLEIKSKATTLFFDFKQKDTLSTKIERHCRVLIQNGFHRTAEAYYLFLEKILKTKLPLVSGDSPYLGRYCAISPYIEDDAVHNVLLPVSITEKIVPQGRDRSFRDHLNTITEVSYRAPEGIEDQIFNNKDGFFKYPKVVAGEISQPCQFGLNSHRYRVRLSKRQVKTLNLR